MAISNGLNPNINALSLGSSSAVIVAGLATGSVAVLASVRAQAGAHGNGSIYLSQNGNGELWFLLAGVWTQVTIN